jgi:hypothetical protein
VSERLRRARGGVRGGQAPARGFGGNAPEKKKKKFFFFRADIFSPVSGRHISGTT